ncbi:MAG: hypothetical protein PWQ10_387 [Patescibacteria group bacterium]|nr:hypothetical protein [Patescibacteria group bacterium]
MILMTVSISFSFAVFQVASSEIGNRLDRFQISFQESIDLNTLSSKIDNLRDNEISKAAENLSIELIYANLIVLIMGGVGSYLLACHSIKPIKKAHEAQSRFTSDASHELRTPLSVMKTEIEVALRDKNPTINELKTTLSSNLEEIDRLNKLSEMLLNLSRLEQTKLKTHPINLNKITNNIIKELKQLSIRMSATYKGRQIIEANEEALTDLIRILINNALTYSPKDSKILINITKQDNFARFQISNSGDGIKADKIPYIFDRFYRADSSRTNNKGYGLGLSLAKKIVELHNGKISVISIPKKETTFTVLLPLKK